MLEVSIAIKWSIICYNFKMLVFRVLLLCNSSAGGTSVLGTFPTESVSVLTLRFSKYNYLIAAGSAS